MKRRRLVSIIMCLVLMLSLFSMAGYGFEMETTIAQAAEMAGYKIMIENQNVTDGNFSMENANVDVVIMPVNQTEGLPADAEITVTNSNTDVIECVEKEGMGAFQLQRKGPGYSTLTFYIKLVDPATGQATVYTVGQCIIEVKLEMTEHDREQVTNNKNESEWMMVFETTGVQKQLKLRYFGTQELVENELVRWTSTNSAVADVDANGTVISKGAGMTTIVASITNGSSVNLTYTTKVIVMPKGSMTQDDSYASYESKPAVQIANKDSFTMYANTTSAVNLVWQVFHYEKKAGVWVEELLDSTSELLQYNIKSYGGSVDFTNVKAGTYIVRAYPDALFVGIDKYCFETKVVVPFVIAQKENLIMNVGDSYDIVKNTNIPSAELFTFNTNDSSIASVTSNGIISANSRGEATITMTCLPGAYQLFNPGVIGNYRPAEHTTQIVTVIDGITLNYGEVTLYNNASLQLEATVTDRTVPVYWSVADEKIATVDANGLVTAVKAGTTIVYAKQTIDGITKTARCIVYIEQSVAEITLDPKEVMLGVGKTTIVQATVKPSSLIGVVLRWVSSDESVVEISEAGNLYAIIEGKKGGSAVLTAINEENVVVGFCNVTITESVSKLTLSETSIPNAHIGEKIQLVATVEPATASDKSVLWRSTNTKVVTVDSKGNLNMVGAGDATIICTSVDNPILTAECQVTVKQPVAGIKLDTHSVELYVGENYRLSYTITPKNASNIEVVWTAFDTGVVAVDKTGMLTAGGVGKTEIMVRTVDGSYLDFCTVEVKQLPTAVKFATSELTLNVGEYFFMNVVLTPADSLDTGLVWEVLDKQIASVTDKGKVTGLKPGSTTISVKAQNTDGSFTETAYCKVTVVEAVEGLKINPETVKLDFGKTMELKPVFTPTEPTNKKIKWTSSDNTIVSIDENGKITALTGGKAVITAVADDGGYTAMCVVTVPDPVLTINPSVIEIEYGEKYELQAVFQPQSASVLKLTWATSDASKVTVDENGVITGQAGGVAVITAKTADGKCDAMCIVTVTEPVTTIKLTPDTLQFGVGEKSQIIAEITNPNASSKELKWSCSDSSVISLDQNGRITGKKVGKAIVTVAATDGSGAEATCEVEVVQAIESLSLNYVTKTIVQGESFALRATVSPSGATYQNPVWSCSNPDIVLIDEKGVVTGIKPGNVWITATANDYVGKSAKCYLTVIPYIGATSVSALENNIVLTPGEKKTVVVKMMPANTTDRMTWISQDESVAKVNASTGEITAVSSGKTTVTVMTDSGKKSTITVTVVGLSRTTLTMKYYSGSVQLYVEGTSEKVRWYSSDESVVVVSANGTVSTRGIGTAEIEAMVNGRTLICKVTVVGY